MKHNSHYNRKLKPLAKALRAASTKAEIRLWCELLSKGKTGYTFLRQRLIDIYIADFICKEINLIIEVDGYSHRFKSEEDDKRDNVLAALGFTMLRFEDEEVMSDLANVQRIIEAFIAGSPK